MKAEDQKNTTTDFGAVEIDVDERRQIACVTKRRLLRRTDIFRTCNRYLSLRIAFINAKYFNSG